MSPIYRTVAGSLIERIGNGEIPPGSRFPSERQLASEFKISRMTARAAVNLLAQRGYVERRNGSGTYVSSPKVELDLSAVAGFTERVSSRMITPGANVIEARTLRADSVEDLDVPAALRRRIGTRPSNENARDFRRYRPRAHNGAVCRRLSHQGTCHKNRRPGG